MNIKLTVVGAGALFLASAVSAFSFQAVSPDDLPECGTFWLANGSDSPPLPCAPINLVGLAPIYALDNGQYMIDDRDLEYGGLELQSEGTMFSLSLEPDGAGDSEGEGGGETSFALSVFTNAPETLLFDTTISGSNGVLPSWRDTRTEVVPTGMALGMALGIFIETNCPFELTRIEAEVTFEHAENLPDTGFEVGFFRGTNRFHYGMYVDPEYIVDFDAAPSMTLTNLENGNWLLAIDLPTYAWGTNRVVTVRAVPNSSGPMAEMSLISCSATVPGVTAYSSDNSNNMVQVSLPKMKVWRRALSEFRAVSYLAPSTDLELSLLPGYQLGSSTNLSSPWDWQTDITHTLLQTVDTREGMGFFLMRPDPTE